MPNIFDQFDDIKQGNVFDQFDSVPKAKKMVGSDMGEFASGVQGFNEVVPFGNRITAGMAALATAPSVDAGTMQNPKPINQAMGEFLTGLTDNYNQARQNQQVTEEANPASNTAGMITGLVTTLPAAVMTGGNATTPILGKVANAASKGTQAVGNFVRGAEIADTASKGARAANLAGQMLRGATVSAPTSAVYAFGDTESDLRSKEAYRDALQAGGVGAALGGAAPLTGVVINKGSKAIGNAVLPEVEGSVKDLAQRAKDLGIPLRLDQIAPSRARNTIQKISQEIPFSGVDNFEGTQRQAFVKAVAKTLGQDADNLNPDVIKNYLSQANNDFESVLKNKSFNIKNNGQLDEILNEASKSIAPDNLSIVKNNIDDVKSVIFKPDLTGQQLASQRSILVKRLPKVTGDAKKYISDIIDYIDDEISVISTPKELEALGKARNQWRNYKTLEPLLEKSPDGNINPTDLMNRVASSPFIKASRKSVGEDDLVDLARIGKEFLPKKGGSDTFQKGAYAAGALSLAANPATTVSVVAGNRAYQKGYNQSQKLVDLALKNSDKLVKKIPKTIEGEIAEKVTERLAPKLPLKINIPK